MSSIALGRNYTCTILNDISLKNGGNKVIGKFGDYTTIDCKTPEYIIIGIDRYAIYITLSEQP